MPEPCVSLTGQVSGVCSLLCLVPIFSSFNTRPGPWRGALLCTWSPHHAVLGPGHVSLWSLAGVVQDMQQLLLVRLPMCSGCCGYMVLFFPQL